MDIRMVFGLIAFAGLILCAVMTSQHDRRDR